VEEALGFLEEFKVSPGLECDKHDILTPYRRITQQLLSFKPLPEDDLLSPDLSTPVDDRLRLSQCLFQELLLNFFFKSKTNFVCNLQSVAGQLTTATH
jgi:hypothetical protein